MIIISVTNIFTVLASLVNLTYPDFREQTQIYQFMKKKDQDRNEVHNLVTGQELLKPKNKG